MLRLMPLLGKKTIGYDSAYVCSIGPNLDNIGPVDIGVLMDETELRSISVNTPEKSEVNIQAS